MKIRLCGHTRGADQLLQRLKEALPGNDIKLKPCIKQCKACRRQPYALLDKRPVQAESLEELFEQLCQKARSG